MRCLYCGKQLAFLRRLTAGGEFCSEAHKNTYHEEYNRVALSRLMQAQSKFDEIKVAVPKASGGDPLAKPTSVRDSEAGWTSVHPRKSTSAPIEAPADPRRLTAPPVANFLIVKPQLRTAAKVETSPAATLQRFEHIDVTRPAMAQHETNFVPAVAGLLKTMFVPVARASIGAGILPQAGADLTSAAPSMPGLPPAPVCIAGLPLAGLIQFDAAPIPPVVAEPEVELAIENEESREPFITAPMQERIPMRIRPFAPAQLTSPIPAGNLAPQLEPVLPVKSPLASRPRLATADPAASQPKERDSSDKPGKKWGYVQKYLKNLVGCFLLASLFGVAGWNFRAGATGMAGQISGGENARPESQLFVYPESLALVDYRVEFEVPVTNRIVEWIFRAADPKNCYVMRLEPQAGSAGTKVQIRKYVVAKGQHVEGAAFRLLRPSDSKYAIKLEIRGSQFRTYSQGQLVDGWNDENFRRGGFGYYSHGGESAPLQSVRFTNLAMPVGPSGRDK